MVNFSLVWVNFDSESDITEVLYKSKFAVLVVRFKAGKMGRR